MAKLTALEVVNEVLRNCGENTVLSVAALTGIQSVVWNNIIQAIQDICTDENTRLDFLEASGQIPLSTGNYQYLISSLTYGANMMKEDIKSLRQEDSGNNIPYITPQEWDSKYVAGIGADRTGYPTLYTKYGGYFVFNNQATANENGKTVYFRYWKLPTYYAIDSNSGTCDIPEPFDRTLLIPLATLKTLSYLGSSEEMATCKVQVFGNGSDIEGSLDKMKRIHASPILKPRVTYQF